MGPHEEQRQSAAHGPPGREAVVRRAILWMLRSSVHYSVRTGLPVFWRSLSKRNANPCKSQIQQMCSFSQQILVKQPLKETL